MGNIFRKKIVWFTNLLKKSKTIYDELVIFHFSKGIHSAIKNKNLQVKFTRSHFNTIISKS